MKTEETLPSIIRSCARTGGMKMQAATARDSYDAQKSKNASATPMVIRRVREV
jgi:hypothetical protein